MQPLVKQHLESLRKTLTEVVMPQLAGQPFVAEQAGLIAASLALLAEVQPYEDDYLRVEFADLCATHALLGLATPEEAPTERDSLAAAVNLMKAEQTLALDARSADNGGVLPDDLRTQLLPFIERQLAREAAWSRLTGFNPAGATLAPIREVLAEQRGQA